MVEDQRGGQRQSGGGGEPVAELDGGEGVEAEVLERDGRVDAVGVAAGQDGARLGADQSEQLLSAFCRRQRGEPGSEGITSDCGRGARPAGPGRDQRAERGSGKGAVGGGLAQGRQVERAGDQKRTRAGGGGVEQGQALLVLDRDEAAADAGLVGGAQLSGHAAGLGPVAPGEAGGGQAAGVAVGGEGVQHGVGGGVVALPGVAQDSRDGGEQHEPLDAG